MDFPFRTDEAAALADLIVTDDDFALAKQIALRAFQAGVDWAGDIEDDLLLVHANGCPLDFKALLDADDAALLAELHGIQSHLDRNTGQMLGFFWPRFARGPGKDTGGE